MATQKLDTGAVATVTVTLPRPGPATTARGIIQIKPGKLALHEGETAADAHAFAQHLCSVWKQHHDAFVNGPKPVPWTGTVRFRDDIPPYRPAR